MRVLSRGYQGIALGYDLGYTKLKYESSVSGAIFFPAHFFFPTMFARSAVSRLPVGAGSGAVRELAKKAVRSRKGFDPTRGWARLHERLSEVPVHLPALKKLEAPPSRPHRGDARARLDAPPARAP